MFRVFPTAQARSYLASMPHYEKKDFRKFFVGANPNAIDLLLKLLDMDSDKRPTAEEALSHTYLAKYHDPEDEVTAAFLHGLLITAPGSPPILLYLRPPSLPLCVQPVCDRQYDDSFESMELDVDGWRSELILNVLFCVGIVDVQCSIGTALLGT